MDIVPYSKLATLSFVEGGEMALFFAAYGIHLGDMVLPIALCGLIIPLIAGDYLWYWCGSRLYALPYIRGVSPHLERLDAHINKHPFAVALIARMSYGIHHATLARLRYCGVSPVNALCIIVATAFVWLVLFGGLLVAYASYLTELKGYLRSIELVLLSGLLIVLTVQVLVRWLFTRYVRNT